VRVAVRRTLSTSAVGALGWTDVLPFKPRQTSMVEAAQALPGRERPMTVADRHVVLGTPLKVGDDRISEGLERAIFGMGCFWGAERIFWEAPGVYTTAVGYAGGLTPNPTYEEVCSGRTGHSEVVLVVFDTAATSFEEMLKLFWEGHDPTQGMRQGNDVGTQYRSLVLCADEAQQRAAEASRDAYQRVLTASGHGEITTEIVPPNPPQGRGIFYYAEDYHQQYLAKSVSGYDCLTGTGIACPIGLSVSLSTTDERSESSSQ
jgi:peptide-methionine (S)-S-oxide reductase